MSKFLLVLIEALDYPNLVGYLPGNVNGTIDFD